MALGILKTKEKDIAFKPSVKVEERFDTPKFEQKEEFIERILKYGRVTTINESVNTASETIYTPPIGFVFFMNSFSIVAQNTDGVSVRLFEISSRPGFLWNGTVPITTQFVFPLSFPLPLKIVSPILAGTSSTNLTLNINIWGYELAEEFLK